jgi:hypothetical protein
MLTTVGTEIPCGGPFQPRFRNLNGRWIETSPTLQLAATPIDVAEYWDEVMPTDEKVLDFSFGGIYDRQAVLDIEEFLQTPRATTGVVISLARQSIHTGLGALEPGHLFTELEDIEWTLWGQWMDFAETYGGQASITIFSLLCLRLEDCAIRVWPSASSTSGRPRGWRPASPASWRVYWRDKRGLSGSPQRMTAIDNSTWPATAPAKDWSLLVKPIPSSSTP